jgi:hypothetical protein
VRLQKTEQTGDGQKEARPPSVWNARLLGVVKAQKLETYQRSFMDPPFNVVSGMGV